MVGFPKYIRVFLTIIIFKTYLGKLIALSQTEKQRLVNN